jgi:hypothetical protein
VFLSPSVTSDLGSDAAPEVNGSHVGVLKGDFPLARVHGNHLLGGTQSDPGSSRPTHHEEAAQDARLAGQAADESEAGRALATHQQIWRPVSVIECRLKSFASERPIRIGKQATELGQVVAKHKPETFQYRTVGNAREAHRYVSHEAPLQDDEQLVGKRRGGVTRTAGTQAPGERRVRAQKSLPVR